jgi:predicted dehydrogenase
MKELVSALIGTGAIARSLHLPAHQRLSGSKLKWVCNRSEESVVSAAREFNIPLWTTNLEDILNDPSVDWVDVAVSNDLHEEVTIRCLEAGKHVLCQKPMAPDERAAERMIAAAERTGNQLGVYMCFRGDPAIRMLREFIHGGQFG